MGQEQSKEFYDEVFSSKDSLYNKDTSLRWWRQNWVKCIEYIKEKGFKSIIDLGCGPGHLSHYLKEEDDIKYTGIDFSDVAIDIAQKHNKNPHNEYIASDLRQFKRPHGEHIFTCLECLEHISFDVELISKLSTNDQILFSVPNYDSSGHVRIYPDHEYIHDRYGEFLDLEQQNVVNLKYRNGRSSSRKIFLYLGIRK